MVGKLILVIRVKGKVKFLGKRQYLGERGTKVIDERWYLGKR